MAKNYSNYTKEQLISHVGELEKQLKNQKYGIYWGKNIEQEKVIRDCIDKIPILVRDNEKTILSDELNNNILIEGDNFHSLTTLKMMAGNKGIADVIYIDPPYNTGAKTWRYNNDYVDKEDGFKHSKWLEMMNRRIKIAKSLLKPDGFFICAIDANELFGLGLLLDDIFGESNRLGLVTILHNPKGRNFTKWFSANSEYMLVYAKNSSIASFNDVAIDDEVKATFNLKDEKNGKLYRLEPFMRSRTETLRENKPNFWYPLYVSKDLKKITREKTTGYYEVYPIANNGKEATWINLPETFDEKNNEGIYIAKNENEKIVIYRKLYEQQVYKNVWIDKKYHSEFNGTNYLKDILGENIFDYPKSIFLMEDILKLTTKKDSLVIDFFAGSGTTGNAVLNLNKQDGGNRKFILCTNNENKICEEVTYQRMRTVITGKRKDGSLYSDGVPNNLLYFKTEFVENDANSDQAKYTLVEKVNELLCIKENVFILDSDNSTNVYYHYYQNNKHLFIYTDIYDEYNFDRFKKIISSFNGEKVVYIYSNNNVVDEERTKDILAKVKPIPSKIYEVYKEIVEDIKGDY